MRRKLGLSDEKHVALVDWMIGVQSVLMDSMQQDVLFLAVRILDDFCAKKDLMQDQILLAGLGCICIAVKFLEDNDPDSILNMLDVNALSISMTELPAMEGEILRAIDYRLSEPKHPVLLHDIAHRCKLSASVVEKVYCIMEHCLLYPYYCTLPADKLVVAALYLVFQKEGLQWSSSQISCDMSWSDLNDLSSKMYGVWRFVTSVKRRHCDHIKKKYRHVQITHAVKRSRKENNSLEKQDE